jgi:hypothetical protein
MRSSGNVCQKRGEVNPPAPDHLHQPPHPLLAAGAEGRQRDADDGLADAGARSLDLLDAEVVLRAENVRPHLRHFKSSSRHLAGRESSNSAPVERHH